MIKALLDKVLSGRLITTIAIVWTYCIIVKIGAVSYIDSLKADPKQLESFVVGLIMGFSGVATLVIKSYFDRNDRPQGGPNGKIPTSSNQ